MNYWKQTYFQVSSPNTELNHDVYDSYEVIHKYGRVRVSGKASKNKINKRTTKLRAYFQRMIGFLRCRKFYLPVYCWKTQRLKQNLSTCSFIWVWSLVSYRNSRYCSRVFENELIRRIFGRRMLVGSSTKIEKNSAVPRWVMRWSQVYNANCACVLNRQCY